MAPGEAPLSRLDELRLQRELKEIMLGQPSRPIPPP